MSVWDEEVDGGGMRERLDDRDDRLVMAGSPFVARHGRRLPRVKVVMRGTLGGCWWMEWRSDGREKKRGVSTRNTEMGTRFALIISADPCKCFDGNGDFAIVAAL